MSRDETFFKITSSYCLFNLHLQKSLKQYTSKMHQGSQTLKLSTPTLYFGYHMTLFTKALNKAGVIKQPDSSLVPIMQK